MKLSRKRMVQVTETRDGSLFWRKRAAEVAGMEVMEERLKVIGFDYEYFGVVFFILALSIVFFN